MNLATAVPMLLSRWLGVTSVVAVGFLALDAVVIAREPAPTTLRSVLELPVARVAELRDKALSETLERALLQTSLADVPLEQATVDYYKSFQDRFVRPEAISVWRILVGSEEQAKTLVAQIKASPTPQKTWSLAAREHSLDKATHFRKGYLGFVRADGSTDVPQVRVSPAVYAAASALVDGAYGEVPFREGEHWAVVWRRGSRKEERVSLERAQPEIAQQLSLAAARKGLATILTTLRAQHVTDYHPELLEALPSPPDVDFEVHKPPRHAHPAQGNPTPRQTDWGER